MIENRPMKMVFTLRLRRCLPVGILRIFNSFSSHSVEMSAGYQSRMQNKTEYGWNPEVSTWNPVGYNVDTSGFRVSGFRFRVWEEQNIVIPDIKPMV